MSPFNINVHWGPVDCIQRNGEITGYLVQYAVVENSTTQTVDVSGDTNETTITGLEPATSYSIQVAAVNSAGKGVYSNATVVTTKGIVFTFLVPECERNKIAPLYREFVHFVTMLLQFTCQSLC